MATQAISYVVPTEGDTGEGDAASIQPVSNGESGDQTVFRRPDENLRSRTEVIRSALQNLNYLSDADRKNVLSGGGVVTWGGPTDLGGTGLFTTTAPIVVRPFLASATGTPAEVTLNGIKFVTNLTVVGGVNPPRAYSGANTISIQINNQAGAPISLVVTGTPANNVVITLD